MTQPIQAVARSAASKVILLFRCMLALLPVSANAAVVYSSPDWTTPGTYSDGWCSSCGGIGYVSDLFTLSSSTTISGIDLEINDYVGSDWNVNVSIWNPDLTTLLFETVVNSGSYGTSPGTQSGAIVLEMTTSGPTLTAGTYRMQFFDEKNMAVPVYRGNSTSSWQTSNRDGSSGGRGDGRGGGDAAGLRFQVYGTTAVPEPTTLTMLGLGLAGIAFSRRRTR